MNRSILLALFLAACADIPTPKDPRDVTGMSPEVLPFVQEFEDILGRSIGDIPIQVINMDRHYAGVCTTWGSEYKEIKLSKDWWSKAEVSAKRALVFHELGHCVLNRAHYNGTFVYNGVITPKSYMYPITFYTDVISELKGYYDDELFHFNNVPMLKHANNSVNN